MKKELSEMTLEALWALFPIALTAHRAWYEDEETRLRAALPGGAVYRLSHIGSTAVDTIWAKPIVDILLEAAERLQSGGYIRMSAAKARASFNRGYTPAGFAERVFHLHLRRRGDNDELYFRDYLLEHPDTARKYEALKRSLWRRFEHDRDAYTRGKGDFVAGVTARAKARYGPRYR